jgi:Dienelactone hydrolase family
MTAIRSSKGLDAKGTAGSSSIAARPAAFLLGQSGQEHSSGQHRAVIDVMRAAGKEFIDVEFSDCDHKFFKEQSERYNETLAKQSWTLGLQFLEASLGIDLATPLPVI